MLTAQIAGFSEWESRCLVKVSALQFITDQVPVPPFSISTRLLKAKSFLKLLLLKELPGSSCSSEQISSKRTKLNMRQSINKNQDSLPPPLYL